MSAAADPPMDSRTGAGPALGVEHPTQPEPPSDEGATRSVPPSRSDVDRPAGPPTRPSPMLPDALADGRYRVTGQLGVGGMGLVMCATDEVLGRDVAVKLLADNLSLDEGSRTRFLREARSAAAVSDPRVVAVYDVGEENGRPYLVMEYVDGPSLADELARNGPLAGEDVLDIATDALAGLGRAHDAGLLHRDVKPGNLLRAPDGTTKVTDFGVAIAMDGDRLTRTGFVIGTAAYLAPERRRGEAATVRTDLWALGATLTELLTGEPPGEAADITLAGRGDEVPPQLRRLLPRLLAADPAHRPEDALAALAILAGDPSSLADTPPAGVGIDPTRSLRVTSGGPPGTPVPAEEASGSTAADTAPSEVGAPAVPGWQQLLLLLALVVGAALALTALTNSGQEGSAPDEGFGPVMVDPEDPAGSVRDLGEQLRERAAG
jgi:eukaryotic-like serine/threonine-protein kinase